MNLEAIADLLHERGVAKKGVNLFINFMPTDKTGILLRDPFGGSKRNHELPGYRQTSFMLIIRHPNFATGKTLIGRAMEVLSMEEADLPTMKVNYMRVRHDPFTFQPSPGSNIEFSTNIDCCYVLL